MTEGDGSRADDIDLLLCIFRKWQKFIGKLQHVFVLFEFQTTDRGQRQSPSHFGEVIGFQHFGHQRRVLDDLIMLVAVEQGSYEIVTTNGRHAICRICHRFSRPQQRVDRFFKIASCEEQSPQQNLFARLF